MVGSATLQTTSTLRQKDPKQADPGDDSVEHEAQKENPAPDEGEQHHDTDVVLSPNTSKNHSVRKSLMDKLGHFRKLQDSKVVGLDRAALSKSTRKRRFRLDTAEIPPQEGIDGQQEDAGRNGPSVESMEEQVRKEEIRNPFQLFLLGTLAAIKIFGFYLINLESLVTIGLTIGLTLYWYLRRKDDSEWQGGGLDFILLGFAVITPISAAIGMAFARRERALMAISNVRSFSYHIYLAHCVWDWQKEDGAGRSNGIGINTDKSLWLEHCDGVLAQLIGIGDELLRFLTLPSASRGRHRMTKSGRREANRTMKVSYKLLESITAQRLTRLTLYCEKLKMYGLSVSEVSRIRQYERFLSDSIEQLRMVKLYRTPQALRAFGRLFTMILPPFYSPAFAQVAIDLDSLAMGILFGIVTALGLTALFESLQVLEDSFVGYLSLDGIDVREEFGVLSFAQLLRTRSLLFPDAKPFPTGRQPAIVGNSLNYHSSSLHRYSRDSQQRPDDEVVEIHDESSQSDKSHSSIPSHVDFSLVARSDAKSLIDPGDDALSIRESSYAIKD